MAEDVASLVGLPVATAQARAEAMGLIVRVLRKDDAATLEERFNRVNLKVEDGKVVAAWKG